MFPNDQTSPILPTPSNSRQPILQPSVPTSRSLPKVIIYQSESMNQLMKVVERVSPSQANVLIQGESGTGKELIANAIHARSSRAHRPFVAINCGALQESLLESELFGHEKGSFTGAYARKTGLAEVANGGTLFLDEIGELAPAIQSKLLRFLQEGEIFRVGGKDPVKVDIRLICATNKDLEKEVLAGRFREDLFYRINTIIVTVPPLRSRKEDIAALITHFLSSGSHAYLNRGREMDPSALKMMLSYPWPGNIRELQNVCERLQILSEGHMIMVSDLPEHIQNPEEMKDPNPYDPKVTIGELERKYILKALVHFEGNKTQAANALGITIKTLYNKLHEYGEFQRFAVHTRGSSGAAETTT